MLLHLIVIACVGGLLYFLANRAPVIAPTVKAIVKWVILVVTCLLLVDALFGLHLLERLR